MDLLLGLPEALRVGLQVTALDESLGAVERRPGHDLPVHVLLVAGALFPDAGVGLGPPADHDLGDPADEARDVAVDAFAAPGRLRDRAEELAVDVELELVV